MDDLKRDQIDIRQAHLMRLQISPAIRIKRLLIQMVAAQWVPLSIEKLAKGAVGDSGGDGGDSGGTGSSSNEDRDPHYGFSLGISFKFDIGR